MGLFSKKEQKLRQELSKKSIVFCKESVKELEELYTDITSAYQEFENAKDQFLKFTTEVGTALNETDKDKLGRFAQKFSKLDKFANDTIRDVRDVLRNQKKRLKESQREL
jgi:hypothetical protein